MDAYSNSLYNLSNLFYINKNYKKAAFYLEKSIETKKTIKVYYLLACSYFKLNELEKAEEMFLKVTNLSAYKSKFTLDSFWWLINIYAKTSDKEKKIKYFFKGLKVDPAFYIKYKWPEGAFNKKEEILIYNYFKNIYSEKDYLNVTLYNSLIYLCYRLNKEKEVKDYIEEMKTKYKEELDSYYWEIIFNLWKKRFNKARNIYKEALKKDKNFFKKYTWEEVDDNLLRILKEY
ncbi:CDC27 family protein [Halothermothrix orenii]|uniref:CDC27 family protein n=1 Tax=Halothermothrix orenii TaxID=31909 RepID=UPI00059F6014